MNNYILSMYHRLTFTMGQYLFAGQEDAQKAWTTIMEKKDALRKDPSVDPFVLISHMTGDSYFDVQDFSAFECGKAEHTFNRIEFMHEHSGRAQLTGQMRAQQPKSGILPVRGVIKSP